MFYILFQAEEAGDVNILSNHNMAMDIVVRWIQIFNFNQTQTQHHRHRSEHLK